MALCLYKSTARIYPQKSVFNLHWIQCSLSALQLIWPVASDHLAVPQGKGASGVLRESPVDFQKQKMLYSILYFLRKHYFLVLKVNEDFFPRGKPRRSAILLLSDVPLTHAVKAEAGLLLRIMLICQRLPAQLTRTAPCSRAGLHKY